MKKINRKKDNATVKRVFVTPDKHFPLADMPAIRAVCRAIEIVKPDVYVDLGDTFEGESVSHWKWKRKRKPPLENIIPDVEKEIQAANAQLDILDEALDKANVKEKHLTVGNHDDWYNSFVEEYPYMRRFGFKNVVRAEERGYTLHPFGKLFKIGKLYFYHGHLYGGQYHAMNHLRKLGVNIMYGHWHDLQQSSVTHADGAKSAWSLGCLKDMSDEANLWLKNRPKNWAHAFAIVDFYGAGYFTVHVIQIIKGKCTIWGELVDGNV